MLSLGVASLAHNLVSWLRPNWSTEQLVLGLGLHVGWIWTGVLIRTHGPWFTATSSAEFAEQAARTQAGVNSLIGLVLAFMIIVWCLSLLAILYKLWGRRVFVGR